MTTDSFPAREHRFQKTGDHEYVCLTWFEHDRQNVRLETPRGRVIFDLWDDDVTDAVTAATSRCRASPALPTPTGSPTRLPTRGEPVASDRRSHQFLHFVFLSAPSWRAFLSSDDQ